MIVTNLLTLHNQLKIHHWQTKSYAEHKALDKAYGSFSDLIDQFIEVFMGKYGRLESQNGYSIELVNYKEISSSDLCDKYISYLVNELPNRLEESDTDLLNIRDEMLGELNKLKYLLTLK
jgi:hypothetical protein